MKEKTEGLEKFEQSVADLTHALTFADRIHEDPIYMAGIVKSFEVCIEYAWKYLRRCALEQQLNPYSPTESVKLAGRIGLIDNVEERLQYLKDRNDATHDYLGISDEKYLTTIRRFLVDAKKLAQKGSSQKSTGR